MLQLILALLILAPLMMMTTVISEVFPEGMTVNLSKTFTIAIAPVC